MDKIACSICNSTHNETMIRITSKTNKLKLYAHKSCLTEEDLKNRMINKK